MTTRIPETMRGLRPSGGDDTAAITAALAANDTVYLGPGNFSYSGVPTLLGQRLIGAGVAKTTLTFTGAAAGLTLQGLDTNPSGVEALTLVGNANATAGILLGGGTGCRRAKVRDVHVTGFTKAGAYGVDLVAALGAGVYYNVLDGVSSYGNAGGFRCYSSDGATNGNRANANTFIGCAAQSNTGDGWFIDWAVGNTLVGCDREVNGGFGVNCDHVLDLTITGGYTESNTSGALNKTANGNVRWVGGRNIDALVGTAASADLFLQGSTGLSVSATGGLGMNATPPTAGINASSTNDLTLALSGATYLTLDHANGMLLANRLLRRNGVAISASAGTLTLAGLTTGYVESSVSANITSIVFPTGVDGAEFDLVFLQTGSFTVAGWPAAVKLAGGAYTLTTGAGKKDVLRFRYHSSVSSWLEIGRNLGLS